MPFSTETDQLTTNSINQNNKTLVFSKLFWTKTSLTTSVGTEPTKQPFEKDNGTNSKLRNLYFITTAFYIGFILSICVALYLSLQKSWLQQLFKNQVH